MSEDIKRHWTYARARIDREARARRDSQAALFELSDIYDQLAGDERDAVDELLAEWVTSDDENLRFDALALIREKRIVRALPALQSLSETLRASRNIGAPYEASKVQGIITRLQ